MAGNFPSRRRLSRCPLSIMSKRATFEQIGVPTSVAYRA
jgi:hypothetical protein